MKRGELGVYCEEHGHDIHYSFKRGGHAYYVPFLALSRQEQLRILGMLAEGLEMLRPQLKAENEPRNHSKCKF